MTAEPIVRQQEFWNSWIAQFCELEQNFRSERQSEMILSWLQRLGGVDLRILEVGCGSGWLAERMAKFGSVAATDRADDVLARARLRAPHIDFIAGDFMRLELPERAFDVVVAVEVLSHVADQPLFTQKLASLLRPGGLLMLATQNAFVLRRMEIPPPYPGQLRYWLTSRQLRARVRPYFEILELSTIIADGDKGLLRLVNSPRLNEWATRLVSQERLDGWKERARLGHTLMLRARVRV